MALAPDSDAPLPPGSLIGPWRLLGCVGGGTFGFVYKAVHTQHMDSPPVALKLARSPDDARFEREAHLLSLLHHPSIPSLHSTGTYVDAMGRSFPFLIMRFIQGQRLYDWAAWRTLSSRQVLLLMAQAARALEATHRHGVHRDVKGDNMLVDPDGRLTLLDFGACGFPGARPLTLGSLPPGTEPYRSHQLLRFRFKHRHNSNAYYPFQPQDDLFALGVTAYYLVTGRYPHAALDLRFAVDPQSPPPEPFLPPSKLATVCPQVENFVLRMLSEHPYVRGTASEVAASLEHDAETAGPQADAPIVRLPSPLPARPFPPLPPPSSAARSPIWAGLGWMRPFASALTLVVFSLFSLHSSEGGGAGGDSPDASAKEDKVALGTSAMASASPNLSPGPSSARSVNARVPDQPLEGQRRTPCEPGWQVAIKGGCWVPFRELSPPCGKDAYEWKEVCYLPIMATQRLPTSTEP